LHESVAKLSEEIVHPEEKKRVLALNVFKKDWFSVFVSIDVLFVVKILFNGRVVECCGREGSSCELGRGI
jgi:hypothetical protein